MSVEALKGLEVCETQREIEIRKATVINSFVLNKVILEDQPTSVLVQYKVGGGPFVLCTLIPSVHETHRASLFVQPGESFRVWTSNGNTVVMQYAEGESEDAEISETPKSLSLLHLNEMSVLTGPMCYTTCSISQSGRGNGRTSLCILLNGKEVTLANLIPGKIETAEIALDLDDTTEMLIYPVGDSVLDLIGYVTPGIEKGPEDEDKSQSSWVPDDNESIDESEVFDKVLENGSENEDRSEDESEMSDKKHSSQKCRVSKEEEKKQREDRNIKELRIVEVHKTKTKPEVRKGDTVRIRFAIEVSGKVVDETPKSGIKFTLGTATVIKGIELGLLGMTVGSKRRILVPPHLAYGTARVGDIPPNSRLVVHLTLLQIYKKGNCS